MNDVRPVLQINNLSVDYGYDDHAVHALREVSLRLNAGEVLGLAGESGCGKSTLAYAATRLLPPPGLITGGEVIFSAADGSRMDLLRATDDQLRASRWDDIAIVFQGAMNSLNPVYRIGKQLTDVIGAHRPETSRAAARDRAVELLDMVGISADRLRAYPHELSGGMRQRVMIAMALALEPQVIIMDEPTTALDVVVQRQILEQISALRSRLDFAVIFITHDVSLLIEMADRIAIMYAGQIIEDASAAEVYKAPRHPYTDGLLHSFPPLRGPRRILGGIPGSPPDLQALPAGCSFQPRCGLALDNCTKQRPLLTATAFEPDEPRRRVACFHHDGDPHQMPDSLAQHLDRLRPAIKSSWTFDRRVTICRKPTAVPPMTTTGVSDNGAPPSAARRFCVPPPRYSAIGATRAAH